MDIETGSDGSVSIGRRKLLQGRTAYKLRLGPVSSELTLVSV